MNLKALASLTLVLFDTTNGKQPFAPKAVATNHALSIRGGAGPLDPALTAKAFLGACSLQGVYDYLAPNKSMEFYGVAETDDVSMLVTETSGGMILGWMITAYGVLFTNMSTLKAIGVAQIPTIVCSLRHILNGDFESAGGNIPMQWISLAFVSFAAHALISGADYAIVAARALAIYFGLATIQFRFAPDAALKSWGLDETKRSPSAIFWTKSLGHKGLVAATLIGALINNVDAYKAFGYSLIPGLISLLLFIQSGDLEKMGCEVAMIYPWIVSAAVTTLTLLV